MAGTLGRNAEATVVIARFGHYSQGIGKNDITLLVPANVIRTVIVRFLANFALAALREHGLKIAYGTCAQDM